MSKKSIKKSIKKLHKTDQEIFMHITSYPGAGKTTLGTWFASKKYIVQDLDDFLPVKTMTFENSKKYVESKIENFLKKHKDHSRIILVGTGCLEPEVKAIPEINAQYKIWLNVSLTESCIRAVKRQLEWLSKNQSQFLAQAKKSTMEDFAIYLENYYSPKKRAEDWKDLFSIYQTLGYKSLKDDIIKELA